MYFNILFTFLSIYVLLAPTGFCQDEEEVVEEEAEVGENAEESQPTADNGEEGTDDNPFKSRVLIKVPCSDGFGKLTGSCKSQW